MEESKGDSDGDLITNDNLRLNDHVLNSSAQPSAHAVMGVLAGNTSFLDTIPEDQSVVAVRIANLSTASANASSSSGGDHHDDDDNDDDEKVGTTRSTQDGEEKRRKRRKSKTKQSSSSKKLKKKRKQRSSGSSQSRSIGSGEHDDTVSETPALLEEGMTEQAPRPLDPSTSRFRSIAFYSVLFFLLVGIIVGSFFIINGAANKNNNDKSSPAESNLTITDAPSSLNGEMTFPPIDFTVESESPTISPSLNFGDRIGVDNVLVGLSGENNVYDVTTPQGSCRYWLVYNDKLELTVDAVGADRIEQRYVICLLYFSTNGPLWNLETPFLEPTQHECTWEGISCNEDEQVDIIQLPDMNMDGTLPTELISLTSLEALSLYGNSLQGPIPPGLFSSLPKLFYCDLSQNALTGFLPTMSTANDVLEIVYLDDNMLEGYMPMISFNLNRLWIEQNLLTGLDEAYTSLNTLTSFSIFENSILGPIPQDWDTPNLFHLDLADNPWERGEIPQSVWELPKLESLLLSNCQLTGTLPSTSLDRISFSDRLRYLWLNGNSLEGEIPSMFGFNWVNLTSLLLHDNDFSGSIGESHCERWSSISELEADCTSSVTCSCCTVCY